MKSEEEARQKRTRLLIDRGFQTRYFATWMTIAFWIAFALSVFYVLGTWVYLRYHHDPSGWNHDEYWQAIRLFVSGNILFVILLILLVGGSALVHSHRIAGACYRMKTDLERFRSGRYGVEITLRQKDFLQDLAEQINETFRHIRVRFRDQERQLELAKDLADSLLQADLPPVLAEQVSEVARRIEVKAELPLEPLEMEEDEEEEPGER